MCPPRHFQLQPHNPHENFLSAMQDTMLMVNENQKLNTICVEEQSPLEADYHNWALSSQNYEELCCE